jgi:CHAD domain-containing protein
MSVSTPRRMIVSFDIGRIDKPIRTLRKFLEEAPKRPGIEQIHDLRTSSRRFETEVDAFGLSSRPNERRLLPHLRRIRKRAGKIRDLDVLTGYLLRLNVSGEQDCIVELVETFGMNRAKHVKELRKLVLNSRTQLRRRLKLSSSKLDKLVKEAQERPGDCMPRRVREAMAKVFQLAEKLKTPAHLNEASLHPYRLKVKALLYVLQLANPGDEQEFVDKLQEVKDAIGEWHDWEELVAIASGILDHGAECKLLPKMKATSAEKYERALLLTNEMRAKFIGLRTSQHFKKSQPRRAISTRSVQVAASA